MSFQEKEVEHELVVKYLKNVGYWKNLLLYWMTLNKVSAYDCNWTRTQNHLVLKRTLKHLAKLGNDIYTGKNSSKNIYLFIVKSSCTRKGTDIWKIALIVIWRHQFQPSISSMVLSLFHRSTWSDLLCQVHCVYFATIIATIHYSKQSVVDSRKFEG